MGREAVMLMGWLGVVAWLLRGGVPENGVTAHLLRLSPLGGVAPGGPNLFIRDFLTVSRDTVVHVHVCRVSK